MKLFLIFDLQRFINLVRDNDLTVLHQIFRCDAAAMTPTSNELKKYLERISFHKTLILVRDVWRFKLAQ